MDLIGYVKRFGQYDFAEKPFSEVDALLFAELAYINFELIAPSYLESTKTPLKLKDIDESTFKKLATGEFLTRWNYALIPLLKNSERYKNVGVHLVKHSLSSKNVEQFFAITFEIFSGLHFISFRGTDSTLTGWKEDFNMSFLDEVPAQKNALEYVELVTKYFDGKFYIGGHSKGGNLAFYSSTFMSEENQKRLLFVYSFDGPGFRNKDFYSKYVLENKCINEKYRKYVTKDDLIGVILNNYKEAKIVDSSSIGILQHNPFTWKIDENGNFVFLNKRTRSSYINENAIRMWLNMLSEEETKFACNAIFRYFENTNVSLIKPREFIPVMTRALPKYLLDYSEEDKLKIKEITALLVKSYKTVIKEEFKLLTIRR